MEQAMLDEMVSERARLIRSEADLTQERFAAIIGISKKTLVEVEKGRKTFGFTTAVAVCVLFRDGEIIRNLFGDAVLEVIDLSAKRSAPRPKLRTLGGLVFWKVIEETGHFRVQHNRVTGHYRIIDSNNYRHFYSYELDEIHKRLEELVAESTAE
ncbi:helix-turn-helix transcriptional regulator [Tumebacillus lipolyticus]|uniref:Helix-turn-helix transcriptional regulator n=1 Tax=Tumebacillus lipolyticus TaxID=1280370 RepID=A0ABW4ZYD8_9BACL